MTLQEDLKQIGLTKTEAAVYLYVLENGQSSPAQIAKGTGILRTNCYHILESLKAHTLLREQTVGVNRKAYIASDPEALFQAIEQKREAVTRILPDLRGLYTTQKHKPKITFYDGLEQIKEVYWRSLEAKEIFAIGSSHSLSAALPEVYEKYAKELLKRNITFHDILTHASKQSAGPAMKEILRGLYNARYLPSEAGDVPTDMLIWDNNVAFITLAEPYFATVMTNPLLSQTMRVIFEAMGKGLK